MIDKVKALHKESRELALVDKKMFPENMNDVLQKRPQQMEKWITDAGKMMQAAFEEDERIDKHPITDYFALLPTPGPLNEDHR